MKITRIKYGESVFGEKNIFADSNSERLLPISFCIYLLQSGGRNILVDAGCNSKDGFVMSAYSEPRNMLPMLGLSVSDITDIIITHSHEDHIEAACDFPDALIHIERREFEGGKRFLGKNKNIHPFDDKTTVIPGVTAERIGGHCYGSCIVRCICGEEYIICGDECYYKENFLRGTATGASVDPEKSLAFVRDFARYGERLLLCHDPSVMPGRVGVETICESDNL